MRLHFPAANGLHPAPEPGQGKPSNSNGERERCGFCGLCTRTGLNLAASLSAEKIRYGLISLETTSSHLLCKQLLSFFFFSLKQTGKRLISLHSHGVILDWHFCDVVSPNLSHNLSLSRLGCGRLAGNQVCIWCSSRNHARFFCVLNPPPLSSSWPPPLSCIREWPISNMSWQTVLSLRWFHSASAKWDKIIKKDKCVQSCCVKVEQTSEGFRSWRYCTWPCYRHTVAVFTRGGLLRMFCTIRWTLKP